MIDAMGPAPAAGASREFVLSKRAIVCDAETTAASSLRTAIDVAEAMADADESRARSRPDARLRRVAADIQRSVQARLPGRVRDLKVLVVDDHFVLSGMASSYYVKQVAQHVAMNALDAFMLGRLVNEIEVRSMR